MSRLPEGWAWTTLGEIAPEVKASSIQPIPGTIYELWSVPSFADGKPEVVDGRTIRSSKRPVEPDDILVCKINPRINRVWRVGEYRGNPQVASPEWIVIRPHGSGCATPKYLQFYLSSPRFREWIVERVSGVTGSHTRAQPREVMSQSIPLPPLPEQMRIVEALEDQLSRLAAAEGILARVWIRSRTLDDMCVDDVVLGRVLDLPLTSSPSDALRGRHDRFDYQALPPLPADWEWALAEKLCQSINSGSTPAAGLMQENHGDVPFLKVYNIDPAGHLDFTKSPTFVSSDTHRGQLRRSITLPGDVVTNIVGPPLGKSATVPDSHPEWNHNQAVVSFRAGDDVEPQWLAACLRSPFIVGLLKSTARATAGQFNIALTTCRELPLPKPPVEVQRALLEELADQQSVLRHARLTVNAINSRSTALRRSVLRAAFRGQLVDQDPSDEPATAALERLRSIAPPKRQRTARRAAVASNPN